MGPGVDGMRAWLNSLSQVLSQVLHTAGAAAARHLVRIRVE